MSERGIWLAGLVLVLGNASCGARTGLPVPPECSEVSEHGSPTLVRVSANRRLGPVDAVILMDTSASAGFYIRGARDSLRGRIAPHLHAISTDARIGLATFVDFPEAPCGSHDDYPFRLDVPLTREIDEVQLGLDRIRIYGGETDQESNVEALYQLATGEGIEPWVRELPPCDGDSIGGACFRLDALPIILHFADSPFHQGPDGSYPYAAFCSEVSRVAHTYDEAVAALRDIGAAVVSFHPRGVTSEAVANLERLATDTAAVAGDEPLVFDLGPDSSELPLAIDSALQALERELPLDMSALLVDPDPDDGFDPRSLVSRVVALEARPAAGVASIERDAGVFRGVHGLTTVVFGVELRSDVPRGPTAQRFRLGVVVLAAFRSPIHSTVVHVVIPGTDGTGCDEP